MLDFDVTHVMTTSVILRLYQQCLRTLSKMDYISVPQRWLVVCRRHSGTLFAMRDRSTSADMAITSSLTPD